MAKKPNIHVHIHTQDNAWEESKHPRRDDGKFGQGSGGASEEYQRAEREGKVKRPRAYHVTMTGPTGKVLFKGKSSASYHSPYDAARNMAAAEGAGPISKQPDGSFRSKSGYHIQVSDDE